MHPLTRPEKSALLVALGAAVVGLSTLTWGVVHLKRRHASDKDEVGAEVENWDTAHVVQWLRDNGVSKAAVAACVRYKVTGEGLLRVTDRDLYRMGVPLRDARVILSAVEDLRESPVLVSRVSLPPTSRQPSIASGSSRPPAAAVTTASPGERFEAAFNALVRTCVLQPGDATPAEQQQRVVVYTSALLECFQALSAREQATALALVAAAEDSAAPTPLNNVREAASAEPAAVAESTRELQAKMQPLHAMVDGFVAFLESPEFAAIPAEDVAELSERVAGQVKRVVRVCEQLPPEVGGPLLRKCEKVFAVLGQQQAATPAATPAAAQEAGNVLLQGLSDVIAEVRDPALGKLPPGQRVKALVALAERAAGIARLASGEVPGAPRNEQVLQIVQPVQQLLREATRISAEEAQAVAEGATADHYQRGDADAEEEEEAEEAEEEAEGGAEAAEGDGAEPGMSAADIPVIVETIQKIQQTIRSAEFQHAPAEVRAELCAVLSLRISALEERTVGLPAQTQNAVRELLRNTQAVLAAVGNAATEAAAASSADVQAEDGGNEEAEEAEEEEAEEEEAEDDQGENEAEAEAPAIDTVAVERYVEQLEKIFEFLTSEALEHAPAEERKRMATELMQRVDTIKREIKGSAAEGPIVSELIDPLYDLLKNMATTHAPSKQFLTATAPLREVQELLDSAAFKQMPHAEKMRIARDVVPQLQQLTSTFAALPPSERAAAEEMVRPISEELLRIVRQRATAEVSAQTVLDRLQAVMRTIQGAEFTTMSPAARSAWAAKAVGDLQRLNDDCVALGPEGDALRPIVQRLESQLRGLFTEKEGEAAVAPPSAPAETNAAPAESGSDVWASVRAMQAELTQAEQRGAFVASARLHQMLNVLSAAAEVPIDTAEQEALLHAFGESLRRHVDGVTAPQPGSADDNGNAAAAAAAKDDDDDDALDSLRVSLLTLLDLALQDGGATGAEIASIAAKAEELIAAADQAGVRWREDAECGRVVRSVLELLEQSSKVSKATGTASSAAPSKVEEVLRSSIQALTQSPPTTRDGFAPFMRVLQLAQPAAEQMTNRELMLLKTLQESVIEAMRRLPAPPHPVGEASTHADEEAEEKEEEGEEDEEGEGEGDDVDAVLDALLDMSFKLRDGVYTAEQLDEFEAIQRDLEALLTRAGIDSTEAMASVREQIRLQRKALHHAEGEEGDEEGEEEEEEEETSPLGGAGVGGEDVEEAVEGREGTNAFNEDDDEAASEGVTGQAAATGHCENDEESEGGEDEEGEEEEEAKVAAP